MSDDKFDRVVPFNAPKKGPIIPSEEGPTPKFDAKILRFPPRFGAKSRQKHSRRNFKRLREEGVWGDVPMLQVTAAKESDCGEAGGFFEYV